MTCLLLNIFLKVKNCIEISLSELDEPNFEAIMKRHIIRWLISAYSFYHFYSMVDSITILGRFWKPVMHMIENFLIFEEGSALLVWRKFDFKEVKKKKEAREKEGVVTHSKNPIKCYRCHKIRHMRKTCRLKLIV